MIQMGSMADSENQTKMLMSRCSRFVAPGEPGEPKAPGTSTTSGASKRRKKEGDQEALQSLPDAESADVQAFLDAHPVDEKAKAKFLAMNPKAQTAVLNMGSMSEARDPTAMLISRCVMVSTLRPGDWCCPACSFINFAKKSECKNCGAAKP